MTFYDEEEQRLLSQKFKQLTPEAIFDVVERDGTRCTGRFPALNSYENRVYQLEREDDSWIVAKFYRPGRWSREALLDEHAFLSELKAEGVPVACPLELAKGETLGEVEGIAYALFEKVAGRVPQELGDEQAKVLGRLLARIHNVGDRYKAAARPVLTPEYYGHRNLEFLLDRDVLQPEVRQIYVATVTALLSRIEPLFAMVPVHRIHGDCHLANLMWSSTGPTLLDFDDMLTGPSVQDIWMLVPSFDAEGQRQRRVLVDAYRAVRNFDLAWLKLVEPLRALRFIHYSTWIARRWDDPAFKRTFSHFGTVEYWHREIQDLREQIARIDHEVHYSEN